MEAGLINDIQNGKREVSCGYDCLWVPRDDGTFEQQEIVGNHVAVVQNGRAGSRVAIKDEDIINEGGNKKMAKKVTKSFLQALGLKTYVKDAEPEDVADALKAMDEDPDDKEVKDEDPEEKKEAKDSAEIAALRDEVKTLKAGMDDINVMLKKLVAKDAEPEEDKKEGADAEFEKLEKEVGDEAHEEPDGDEVKDEGSEVFESKDEEPDGDETKDANPLIKIVQDMKPIIMAIPDEKARLDAAKKFAKSVRDAKATMGSNGYGNIINTINSNKLHAMDANKPKGDQAQSAAAAWNKRNAQNEGGLL
jgi:hypothetical protein